MFDVIESLENPETLLDTWRQTILMGNQAFSSGNILKARVSYQTALQIALEMMKSVELDRRDIATDDADLIIAALVITQHNLADLHVRAGLPGQAADHLCEAHEIVFGLLKHPEADIAQVAWKHFRITTVELMNFVQIHGDCLRVSQTLCATQLPSPSSQGVPSQDPMYSSQGASSLQSASH